MSNPEKPTTRTKYQQIKRVGKLIIVKKQAAPSKEVQPPCSESQSCCVDSCPGEGTVNRKTKQNKPVFQVVLWICLQILVL